jgi:hypothetical protein
MVVVGSNCGDSRCSGDSLAIEIFLVVARACRHGDGKRGDSDLDSPNIVDTDRGSVRLGSWYELSTWHDGGRRAMERVRRSRREYGW